MIAKSRDIENELFTGKQFYCTPIWFVIKLVVLLTLSLFHKTCTELVQGQSSSSPGNDGNNKTSELLRLKGWTQIYVNMILNILLL